MQMTPEQVKILQQVALQTLETEAKTTQRVIEAIPAEKCSYKPDSVSMCALDLAKHIANSELQFLRGIIAGKFDFGGAVPESVKTPADVSRWYGEELQEVAAQLKALPPEKLGTVIDFMGFMQMPGVLYLNLAVNHSIHHRGQLSMHLRPMGAKVPSIYGPSYDTEQAQKAASTAS
jgi:uncharacterized damage-inducible protein DinB